MSGDEISGLGVNAIINQIKIGLLIVNTRTTIIILIETNPPSTSTH